MLVAALVAFGTFYVVCHFLPVLVIALIAAKLVPSGDMSRVPALQLALLVWWVIAMYATIRRTAIAANAYAVQGMSFWEAHGTAGATLKAELSFLPVVGRWFARRD
ncbi:MAG: hypothetical protein IPK64_18745 [bacterium]|nr:hypothetical protein [bacterium]